MKAWRGIHIFSRVLPENYLRCQLLAWLEMRKHPLWLEHWEDVRIVSAQWHPDPKTAEIEIELTDNDPLICCGIRDLPSFCRLNGREISPEKTGGGTLLFRPEVPGILSIGFSQ